MYDFGLLRIYELALQIEKRKKRRERQREREEALNRQPAPPADKAAQAPAWAGEVLRWGRDFARSREGRVVLPALGGEFAFFHLSYLGEEIAGEGGTPSRYRVSLTLNLKQDGSILCHEMHRRSYYHATTRRSTFTRPDEMAERLDPRFLEWAAQDIASGDVWDLMEERLMEKLIAY